MKAIARIVVAFFCAFPAYAQDALLAGGDPVSGNLAAGASRGFAIRVDAGDLVTGVLQLGGPNRGLDDFRGRLEIVDASGAIVRTFYAFEPLPGQRRIGFVASRAGTYQLRIVCSADAAVSFTIRIEHLPVSVRMRDLTIGPSEPIVSRRLQQLAADVARGEADAVTRFWKEREGQGPLVETTEPNQDPLVTFLWRATYETRNVLVDWPVALHRAINGQNSHMARLSGTDLWYKSIRLHAGSRFTYGLSPNDRPEDRALTSQLDPLNPRQFPDDPKYRFERSSVLEMAGAIDERWVRQVPSRRGAIVHQSFKSDLLSNERDMWVYTPPGYTRSAGPYPLIVMFDGAAYVRTEFQNAPATLDNLIDAGRIRPPVVCFVDSPDRRVELGFGEEFGKMIAGELLPMLRSSYGISPRREDVILAGSSAGGLAAALMALRHPDAFGNVLSMSGFFRSRRDQNDREPNAVSAMYAAANRLPVRFYLETGVYEPLPANAPPFRDPSVDESFTAGNRHFRDVLIAKGYDITYRETASAHEAIHWRAALAEGLMALLQP